MKSVNWFLFGFFALIAAIAIVIGIFTGVKGGFIFVGLFSLLMYSHLSITHLSNALLGSPVNSSTDGFWKLFFILIGAIALSVGFVI